MRTGQQLEAFSTTFGLLASLLLHAAVFGYVASRTADFDFDFDLTLPAEVEFGLTEGMAATATPRGTARPSTANRAIGELTEDHTPELDAGVPDSDADSVADTDTDAGTDPDADTRADNVAESDADAETDTDTDIPVGPSAIAGPSRIPPGAQLALRIDMKRIRESPLGQDVTRFLSGVPDWQLLLAGSG
ncbi:MAG: MSCRAMM family adhesin SdrC, partial [Myxococcales bacterium]|nr:MSCRAMM family adhesin SdrC [Myxococcales bacterium]